MSAARFFWTWNLLCSSLSTLTLPISPVPSRTHSGEENSKGENAVTRREIFQAKGGHSQAWPGSYRFGQKKVQRKKTSCIHKLLGRYHHGALVVIDFTNEKELEVAYAAPYPCYVQSQWSELSRCLEVLQLEKNEEFANLANKNIMHPVKFKFEVIKNENLLSTSLSYTVLGINSH